MNYRGKIQDGVVVLQDGARLPEGMEVSVVADGLPAEAEKMPTSRALWEKLVQLGTWAESQPCSLPTDLAANHDHYLHGLSKRKRP